VSPYAAPARVETMQGLPPAFIAVGTLDLFLEENIGYGGDKPGHRSAGGLLSVAE